MKRLRVLHSLPPLQFAPLFVALGRRMFESAGVEVETVFDARRERSVEMLLKGEIDCFVSGPLRTFDLAGKGVEPIMATIAVINHRCPFYVVGSGDGASRPLEALRGSRVIRRRAAPPVNLLLSRLVKMAEIEADSIAWIDAPEGQTEVEALTNGLGEYAVLAEPEVEALVASSRGHIALNLPREFGPMHFASAVAPRGFIDKQPELAGVLVKTIQDAKDWMCGAASEDVADALAAFMPDTPHELVAGAVRRGQRDGMWAGGPAMARWHYEVLREAYTGENPRLKPVPFSEGVDNRIADEVAATASLV